MKAMARTPKKSDDTGPIVIRTPQRESIDVFAIGAMPKIFNAVSEKAKRELLFPAGTKNRAARESSLKHEPMLEYRNSVYRFIEDTEETRLCIPATAFKAALLSAALRTPGVMKTEIGQLLYVRSLVPAKPDYIPVWGLPQMSMMVVRNSDISRTPDIRTRAIMPVWCCKFRLVFTKPLLNASTCVNLLGTAGMICGVGDFRQEKGKGSYGQFELVDPGDPLWSEIATNGGREAQDAALENPEYYDHDTLALYTWFVEEVRRRGRANLLSPQAIEQLPAESELRKAAAAAAAAQRQRRQGKTNGEEANAE